MNNKIPLETQITKPELLENSGCSSCDSHKQCGLGIFSTLFPRQNSYPEVLLSESQVIIKTFLLYIAPVILLIIGSALAQYWYPNNVLIPIVFACISFASGVIMIFLKHSGNTS